MVICNFLIPYPTATSVLAPQTSPSISTLRTAFSSATMSVSSSHGLTSNVTTDLAAVLGLVAFFAAYAATRSALSLSASASSSSSSPKRSTSSSSSSAGASARRKVRSAVAQTFACGSRDAPPRNALPPSEEPGRDSNSAAYDLMWLYHLNALVVDGGEVMALKTETSACEGVYLCQGQCGHMNRDGECSVSTG